MNLIMSDFLLICLGVLFVWFVSVYACGSINTLMRKPLSALPYIVTFVVVFALYWFTPFVPFLLLAITIFPIFMAISVVGYSLYKSKVITGSYQTPSKIQLLTFFLTLLVCIGMSVLVFLLTTLFSNPLLN